MGIIAENYIKLIKAGRRTLESLPENLPADVRAEIKAAFTNIDQEGEQHEPTGTDQG